MKQNKTIHDKCYTSGSRTFPPSVQKITYGLSVLRNPDFKKMVNVSFDITDNDILYEDNHLIAVNKRAGDIVQVDDTGDEPLDEKVKKYIAKKYNKPNGAFLGVVHRLDRPVSGVILFAKTSKALERMNELFKTRQMRKIYYAVVRNRPNPPYGNLVHWLVKNPKKNVTTAHGHEVKGSLRSELHYRMVGELNGYYLIQVNPITGRPHQIRVQLASLNSPIVGDNKYGYPRGSLRKSICLHARRLQFIHPVKNEPIDIKAPLPKDGFWEKFAHLINDKDDDVVMKPGEE